MRTMALLAVFPLVIMTPALAQDQPAKSNGNAQAIQQQVQNNLRQAGFTDIQIMPSSFLVRAKDSAGNPVMMGHQSRFRNGRDGNNWPHRDIASTAGQII